MVDKVDLFIPPIFEPPMTLNKNLRLKIARMVKASGEGHIPSSYSIVDLIDHLYDKVLRVNAKNPKWAERDFYLRCFGAELCNQ